MTEASGGALRLTIYPEEALGNARAHYRMVRDGSVDLAFVNPAFERERFVMFSLGELPLLVSDSGRGSQSFDRWYRTHAPREMADVKCCMSFLFGPGALHSARPVVVPTDMVGLKVRTANDWIGHFVDSVGAVSVTGRVTDAREIVASGRADAITLPWDSLFIFKLDALLRHHVDLPLYMTPFALLMSRTAFDQLPIDQQRVLDQHCTPEWAERIGTDFASSQVAGLARMRSLPAHIIHTPDPEQRQQWVKAAKIVERRWMEGPAISPKQDALGAYRSALEKNGALMQ